MLPESIRADFPFYTDADTPLVYLDNAATTQKPAKVVDAIADAYRHANFNVHRSVYTAAQNTTDAFEAVRGQVARFINAPAANQVVFTRGTTEGLNMVVNQYFADRVQPGDEIVVAISEHHSNLLPWQQLAHRCQAQLRYLALGANGRIDLDQAQRIITDKTRLVAVAAVSNVLGTVNPVSALARLAHSNGAEIVVDAAQAAPEIPIDVLKWDADWLAFSGHKMLGPTGIGVLYGKADLLARMEPAQLGGEMVAEVSTQNFTTQPVPWRLEAGTPNFIGVLGLGAAIDYLQQVGMDAVRDHCQHLGQLLADQLSTIDGVHVYGDRVRDTGIVAFNIDGVHAHDVASTLDLSGIAVRAGYHCAEPLMHALQTNGSVRASAYLYNTAAEVAQLVDAVRSTKEFFSGQCK